MEALSDPASVEDAAPEDAPRGAPPRHPAPDAVVVEERQPREAARVTGSDVTPEATPAPPALDASTRPMLRLVRNTVRTLIGARDAVTAPPAPAPASAPAPESPHEPAVVTPAPAVGQPDVVHVEVHPRRGVCASYYVNQQCWEVPDAFCNHALHTCMLRDCPVYNLHREELERRFASKYSHLW
jgi:hypothetical protein